MGYGDISTHDLTKRSTTKMPPSAFQDTEISTHDLTKRSTRNISKLRQFFVISTHDLTKRSTNRLLSLLVFQLHFNSRPHEEVDFGRLAPRTNALNFNSRPHEEVDRIRQGNICRLHQFQLTTSRRGRPGVRMRDHR